MDVSKHFFKELVVSVSPRKQQTQDFIVNICSPAKKESIKEGT